MCFRFPQTPHLLWQSSSPPRSDKILTDNEQRALLSGTVVVEEKFDGANLGFSFDEAGALSCQNRGTRLTPPFSGQFSKLNSWIGSNEDSLFDGLGTELVAFGEWCAARHTIAYDKLPDWWLLFDIYDRGEGKFWSVTRRNEWAIAHGFKAVPTVFCGQTSVGELADLAERTVSAYSDLVAEGLVVRKDDDQWSIGRAKIVRADFSQSIVEHWSRRPIVWNSQKSAA